MISPLPHSRGQTSIMFLFSVFVCLLVLFVCLFVCLFFYYLLWSGLELHNNHHSYSMSEIGLFTKRSIKMLCVRNLHKHAFDHICYKNHVTSCICNCNILSIVFLLGIAQNIMS